MSTPIAFLPVELLSRVFLLAARNEHNSPFPLNADQDAFPPPIPNTYLWLSHVDRRWRSIALRTPQLWSLLHFREPAHLARATTFLERVKRSPNQKLDILVQTVAINDHVPGITLCRAEFHKVFDIITPHVSRWRSFSLKVRDNECKAGARAYLSSCGPAPALETLQLYHFEDFGSAQNLYLWTVRPPVMIFDGHLPALSNVSLIGVNLPWAHTPFLRNLRNLQFALHSESVRPEWAEWAHMLRSSPHLQTLTLHYSGPRSVPPDAMHSPIVLHRLEDLALTDLDPDQLCALFETLALPGLRRLTLDLPEQNFSAFVVLLADVDKVRTTETPPRPRTSLKALTSLTISSLECSLPSFRNLLAAIPSLTHFEIDFARAPKGCWTVFAESKEQPKENGAEYLPALQHLTLAGLTGAQLRDIIVTRSSAASYHTRYTVRGRTRQRDAAMDSIVDEGVQVELGDGKEVWVDVEWVGEDEEEEEEGEEEEEEEESESEEDEEGDEESGGDEPTQTTDEQADEPETSDASSP